MPKEEDLRACVHAWATMDSEALALMSQLGDEDAVPGGDGEDATSAVPSMLDEELDHDEGEARDTAVAEQKASAGDDIEGEWIKRTKHKLVVRGATSSFVAIENMTPAATSTVQPHQLDVLLFSGRTYHGVLGKDLEGARVLEVSCVGTSR